MPAVFVTGTGTDVGKTYVTAALVRALRATGRPVDVFKPLVSGFDPAAPGGSDPAVLLEAMSLPLDASTLDRISPFRYRAPLAPSQAAAREGVVLDGDAVIALCRARIAAAGDALLLIEGAGGVMSPLDDDRTMLDLAAALDAPVLLTAGSYLGTLSHTLTACVALSALDLRAVAVSESLDAPPLADAAAELRRRLSPTPVFALARDGSWTPEQIDLLAGLLSARR